MESRLLLSTIEYLNRCRCKYKLDITNLNQGDTYINAGTINYVTNVTNHTPVSQTRINLLFFAVSTLIVVFLSVLAILSFGSTLTADDYQFYANIGSHNTGWSFLHYGSTLTGRYGNALILILSIKLLGIKALAILPILSLLVLMLGVGYTVYRASFLIKGMPDNKQRLLVASALFVCVSSFITAPSLFDTYVWFAAATVYVTAGAVLAIIASIISFSLRRNHVSIWFYGSVLVLSIFVGGFYEVIPVLLIFAGVTSLVLMRVKTWRTIITPRQLQVRAFSIVVAFSGLISGLLLRFSPWTVNRISTSANHSLANTINIISNHFQLIPEFLFSWKVIFVIFIALLLYVVDRHAKTIRYHVSIILTGLVLVLVPLLIVAGIVGLSGLVEANRLGSNRLLFVATTGIMTGSSLVLYSLLHILGRLRKNTAIVSVCLIVFLGLSAVTGISSLLQVNQAVYTKRSMMEYREAVINYDLSIHSKTVRIIPDPVLLPNSQILDTNYNDVTSYWLPAIREYYHIPSATTLLVPTHVLAGYCTTFSSSPNYNKQTCADIAPSTDTEPYTHYK